MGNAKDEGEGRDRAMASDVPSAPAPRLARLRHAGDELLRASAITDNLIFAPAQ